jgi:hypothetical protein
LPCHWTGSGFTFAASASTIVCEAAWSLPAVFTLPGSPATSLSTTTCPPSRTMVTGSSLESVAMSAQLTAIVPATFESKPSFPPSSLTIFPVSLSPLVNWISSAAAGTAAARAAHENKAIRTRFFTAISLCVVRRRGIIRR